MAFHDVQFPPRISFGSSGGPERRTDIVTLTSGFEERNSPWAQSRRRFDAGMGLMSLDDMAELVAFFEARHGQLYGFRWKDWTDFKSCAPSAVPAATDESIATGDGVETQFQLTKRYSSGPTGYDRPITHPVVGTVKIALDGVVQAEGTDFSVEGTTGLVTFGAAPGNGVSVQAGFEFDVPVRFDTDRIVTSVASFQAGEVPDVPVVELRV